MVMCTQYTLNTAGTKTTVHGYHTVIKTRMFVDPKKKNLDVKKGLRISNKKRKEMRGKREREGDLLSGAIFV